MGLPKSDKVVEKTDTDPAVWLCDGCDLMWVVAHTCRQRNERAERLWKEHLASSMEVAMAKLSPPVQVLTEVMDFVSELLDDWTDAERSVCDERGSFVDRQNLETQIQDRRVRWAEITGANL